MQQCESRARFEEHIFDTYGANNHLLSRSYEGYVNDEIDGMWTAWQACWASREFIVELPQQINYTHWSYGLTAAYDAEKVKAAIEKAGGRAK